MNPTLINDGNYLDIVKTLVADERNVPRGTNLQNIPSRGPGERVRNTFKPLPGCVFLGGDLGQIEPRIQADIMYREYGDNSLRQIFLDGVDLYSTMAERTFGLAPEYCVDKAYDPTGTFKPRGMMKTGVLAKSYDQSKGAFAKKMGVTDDVAEHFFTSFDEAFPSFSTMVRDIREGMTVAGYVETLLGRRKRFPKYKEIAAAVERDNAKLQRLYNTRRSLAAKRNPSANEVARLQTVQDEIDVLAEQRGWVNYWLRAAFNGVIQGTGADILKMIGIENAALCKARGWEFNASIHDEVKNTVPLADLTPETVDMFRKIMTETFTMSVPIVTDIVIETAWMVEYSPDAWDFENKRPKEAA